MKKDMKIVLLLSLRPKSFHVPIFCFPFSCHDNAEWYNVRIVFHHKRILSRTEFPSKSKRQIPFQKDVAVCRAMFYFYDFTDRSLLWQPYVRYFCWYKTLLPHFAQWRYSLSYTTPAKPPVPQAILSIQSPPCGWGPRSAGTRLATSYAENWRKYAAGRANCPKRAHFRRLVKANGSSGTPPFLQGLFSAMIRWWDNKKEGWKWSVQR